MKTSEFIDEVRDSLFAGWTQGSYRRENGDVCILGALDRVALRNLGQDGVRTCAKARKELTKTAAEMFPGEFFGDIPSWNDCHASHDDVLNLCDKTAMRLLEAGE